MEHTGERQSRTPTDNTALDRKEIAVKLRQNGIEVDFEDWDGLTDLEVAEIVWNKVWVRGGIDFETIIPEEQLDQYTEWPYEV